MIENKIHKALGNRATAILFEGLNDVRVTAYDKIRSGIDHRVGEHDLLGFIRSAYSTPQ